MRREGAYTSVSFALSHTLDINPARTPPAIAAFGLPVHRDIIPAKVPHAAAVQTADRRFTEYANPKSGASALPHTLPMRMKSGVPGGCGTPSDFIAARNSPASQYVTPGASVNK
jgi:hypothetical protein